RCRQNCKSRHSANVASRIPQHIPRQHLNRAASARKPRTSRTNQVRGRGNRTIVRQPGTNRWLIQFPTIRRGTLKSSYSLQSQLGRYRVAFVPIEIVRIAQEFIKIVTIRMNVSEEK